MDFWDGQTYDQISLKIEAVNDREGRELVRAAAGVNGLDDPEDAFPRWHDDGSRAQAAPLDFDIPAQRGIVIAVERGLIPPDVWRTLAPGWERLLAATGDYDEWDRKRREHKRKGGR